MSDVVTSQRVADELEVRNLIARLAHMADMAGADDLDEYMTCYTDDAVWDFPGGSRSGKPAILEGALERRRDGSQGPGAHSRHVVATQAVRFEDDDTAVSDAYLVVLGSTDQVPTVKMTAYYHDTLKRTPDGWKLAYRKITPG